MIFLIQAIQQFIQQIVFLKRTGMGGCVIRMQKAEGNAAKQEQRNSNWNNQSSNKNYQKTGTNENTINETNCIEDLKDTCNGRTRNLEDDETMRICANQQQRRTLPLKNKCSQATRAQDIHNESGSRTSIHVEQQLQMPIVDSKIVRKQAKKKILNQSANLKIAILDDEQTNSKSLQGRRHLSHFIEDDIDLRQTFVSSKQNDDISNCKMKRYEAGLSVISETSNAEQSTFNKMSVVSITPTYNKELKSRKMSQAQVPCSPCQKYGPMLNQNYFIQVKI